MSASIPLALAIATIANVPSALILSLLRRRAATARLLFQFAAATLLTQFVVSLVGFVIQMQPDRVDSDHYHGVFLFLGAFVLGPILQFMLLGLATKESRS